jgi:hypothetical protein
MVYEVPEDLEQKAAIMREFGRMRAAGEPVPPEFYAKHVNATIRQSFELPKAQPMEIAALGETLPVFGGSFQGLGSLLLKFPTEHGATVFRGQLRFQQCSDTVCDAPETVPFELPLTIEPFMVPPSRK